MYRTGDRLLAEETVSETFARALAGRARFDRRKASEKTWIYAIALGAFQGVTAVLALFLADRFQVTEQTRIKPEELMERASQYLEALRGQQSRSLRIVLLERLRKSGERVPTFSVTLDGLGLDSRIS